MQTLESRVLLSAAVVELSGLDDTTELHLDGMAAASATANEPPVNSVPGSQTTQVNTPIAFTDFRDNLVTTSDADAGLNPVRVMLTAEHGHVTLINPDPSGLLTYSEGDGFEDVTMTFSGQVDTINTALEWVSFQPDVDYVGTATMTITTNDQGYFGTGGPQEDSATINIEVAEVPAFDPSPSWTTLPAALDTSFDEDGMQTLSLSDGSDYIRKMVLLDDGKILAVGTINNNVGIMRFNSDMSLDSAFGTGGFTATELPNAWTARDVEFDKAGRIIVATQYHIIRYSADGILDTSFGTDGNGAIYNNNIQDIFDLTTQADGKWVAFGRDDAWGVTRYNANWTHDADGAGGFSGGDRGFGVTTSDNGDLVFASSWDGGALLGELHARRYSVNLNFEDGAYIYDGSQNETGNSILELPDGKVLTIGHAIDGMLILRRNPNGSIDDTFGDASHPRHPGVIIPGIEEGREATLQADGKILITGSTSNGSNHDFHVVRMSYDGELDTDFNGNGKLMIPFSGDNDYAYSVLSLPDGKVLTAGRTDQNGETNIALVRLYGDNDIFSESNTQPTLDPLADVIILEDDPEQTVSLTGITEGDSGTQPLHVTTTSSNTGLIPNPTVTYTSANATGSIAFTPVADQSGTATITVTVEDGGLDNDLNTPVDNATFSRTFEVTVNPINDDPTLDVVSDLTVDEDAPEQTVNLAGITAGGGESQPLKVIAASSSTGLIPNPAVTYSSANATGTLKFTTVTDQSGTATITVTVEDGGLDGNLNTPGDNAMFSQTFDVTVNPVTSLNDVAVAALANGSEVDGSPLQFEFTRTGDTTTPLTVNYRLFGTALSGIDFTGSTTGTVTFAAGETSTTLSLPVLLDSVIDPGETVRLRIDPSTEYDINAGSQFATATITAESVRTDLIPQSYPQASVSEERNLRAFAALKQDGSVVTWGDAAYGGDSSSVAIELSSGISQVFSTRYAFAALKQDGSVVTWGDPTAGGDSSSVATQLSGGVTQIFSAGRAFAALKQDGSIVTWGNADQGGDSSSVATQLSSGVSRIFSARDAFAALKEDGSVVTWGSTNNGGDSSSVATQLSSGVSRVFSNERAFAALKGDGSVVTWGLATDGGDSSSVATQLSSGVSEIFSTEYAFAALKEDGSVVTWGSSEWGGNSSSVITQLGSGVSQVFSAEYAFAALKEDGSVVTWGEASWGGDSSSVAGALSSGVSQVFPARGAFAALKEDGSVVTWGDPTAGGDSSSVTTQLSSGVSQIFFTKRGAFAALKEDGSVVTWGNATKGGDSSSVAGALSSGVAQVFSNDSAFAALKEDGSVVTWGNPTAGGDSSSVAGALISGVVAFANPFTDDVFDPPAVNVTPTLDAISDLTIDEDAPEQTVSLTGITAGGGESQPLKVTSTSNNTGLIPNPTVTYTSPNITSASQTATATVVVNEFIYSLEAAPTPQAHASTIADLGDGKQVAAWFGGTGESNADVGIWISRYDGNQWSTPEEVATGAEDETQDYPTWNPVLFQPADGPLHLFYKVGPTPRTWWGRQMTSNDGGVTWSDSIRLPDPILGPIKNPPVQLADGTIISPSSTESNDPVTVWEVHFEISQDNGQTWQKVGPVDSNGFSAIQPSILVHPDGRLQALARSREGVIVQTWSSDNGQTWSPLESTGLPNPSSGIDAATLANGRFALAYNPVDSGRTPLVVALSDDGVHWDDVAVLEDTPGEYSYPTLIQTADGRLHVTYTWQRLAIRHAVVELDDANDTGSLAFTPIADQSGTATITVTVEDGGLDNDLNTPGDNAMFSRTFDVTVNAINDDPTLDALSDLTIDEDAPEQTVSLTGISTGGGETQPLRVMAASSNTGLIPNPTVTYTSAEATGSLQFTPAPDQYGTAIITVTVEDGGLDGDLNTQGDNATFSRTFDVTVNPVNDSTDSLVAYWDFEGDALDKAPEGTVADDGTLVGAAIVGGGLGTSALEFSGGGEVMKLESSSDINQGNTTEKSISLWFQPSSVKRRQVLYQQGGNNRGLNIYLENGSIYAGGWNAAVGWDGTWLSSANITQNAWNHVTFTYNAVAGEVQLYVNGDAPLVGAASAITSHGRATLGSAKEGTRYKVGAGFENSSLRNSYTGLVDDVRVYEQTLTAAEAAELSATAPADQQLDLVAYWDFEGDTLDKATGGTVADNGTLSGAGIVSGGLGTSALEFSGGGEVMKLESSSDINLGSIAEKSISLWFQPNSVKGRQVLYQQGGNNRGLNIYLENGSIYAGGWNAAVGWAGTWLSSANITQNAWNHVTFTYNAVAGEVQLYVNGAAPLVGTASPISSHGRATLGTAKEGSRYQVGAGFENSSLRNSYTGLVDDVRVHDRALTDEEAAELSANAPADQQLDLVAYWDFEGDALDNATGGTVADDGTLTGAAFVGGGLGTSALEFSGGGDVMTLESSADINQGNTTEESISLWFRPDSLTGRQVLYQQGGNNGGLNIYLENGSIYAGGWNAAVSWDGTWLSSANITQNAWNHVTFTYNAVAGEVQLYVNGAAPLVGTASAISSHGRATLGSAREGSRYKVGAGFVTSSLRNSYTGLIDDVRVYDRALTDEEAALLAAASPV